MMRYPVDPIQGYLARRYGGKKAFAMAIWHACRSWLGALDDYKRINWQSISRVIFVCKGNICRSAFAQHRFRAFGMEAASMGLDADSGSPANERAVRVAGRLGADLAQHRSSHVSDLEVGDGDLLVAFEPEHADRLRRLFPPRSGVQVTLLGLWSPLPRMAYLHDPYGLPEAYFETCFGRIERGLEGIQMRVSQARSMRDAMT